jgi:DNA-directed RNA polymerase specialized sigma24 family protein
VCFLNLRFGFDHGAVQDIATRAIDRLDRHVRSLEPEKSPAWHWKVCERLLLNGRRMLQKHMNIEELRDELKSPDVGSRPAEETWGDGLVVDSEDLDTHLALLGDLVAEMVDDATNVGCLKATIAGFSRERAYIFAATLRGMTGDEIADALDTTRGAVYTAIHRMRSLLKKCRANGERQ